MIDILTVEATEWGRSISDHLYKYSPQGGNNSLKTPQWICKFTGFHTSSPPTNFPCVRKCYKKDLEKGIQILILFGILGIRTKLGDNFSVILAKQYSLLLAEKEAKSLILMVMTEKVYCTLKNPLMNFMK
jgi:hypothetical protein